MKLFKSLLVLAAASLFGLQALAADKFKPFTLASSKPVTVDAAVAETKDALAGAGLQLIGEYKPYDGVVVLVYTSDDIQAAVSASENGGFGAVQRVSVSSNEESGEVEVSYVNPQYLAYAYRLNTDLSGVKQTLADALGAQEDFGSKKGLSEKSLRRYHYMIGMEYFTDPYKLGEFATHEESVSAVEQGLANNDIGLGQVYKLPLAGGETVLFGVSMTGPSEKEQYYDDAFQMSIVDFQSPSAAAYLPYEVLVTGNKVIALHMRFRMAVHFPDLSMMGKHSFMTLRPSPDAIEKALKAVVTP